MATALAPTEAYDVNNPTRNTVHYKAVTAEKLQDSPVFTGQYAHEYELAPEVTPKHYLDIFAPKPNEVKVRPKVIDELSNLVREAGALYGSRHYDSYRFLLTLTKNGGGGTEHHECSDNGMFEDVLETDNALSLRGDLLPHEFTHSWNGKFRRPEGEFVQTFSQPMRTDLLWVYEGLTDFLGKVLAVRSGLTSADQFKQALALEAAQFDNEPGRTWRSIDDTAVAVKDFRTSNIWASQGPAWTSWRRSWDFYQEGDLLWLDVDTTIRQLTKDKKNLRDFLVLFLGVNGNTGPEVLPYTFEDLVGLLGKVAPYDWANFFKTRVYDVAPHANLRGIEQAGYRIAYGSEPNTYESQMRARPGSGPDVWFSLGFTLTKDGTIGDVMRGGVGDRARLGPGEKIIAIGGRTYSDEAVVDALNESKTSQTPIEAIVQSDYAVTVVRLDYHDGPRYPALVRVEGTPDYFAEILAPMTSAKANPQAK
jgi:predicted metalloprotease with PDZ domain